MDYFSFCSLESVSSSTKVEHAFLRVLFNLSFLCIALLCASLCSPAPRVPRTWRGAFQRGRGEIFFFAG